MTATLPLQSRSIGEFPRPTRPEPDQRDLTTLAAELHDGLAQELFAARMMLDEALALSELPPETQATLKQLSVRLAGSSRTLRTTLLRWRQAGRPRPTSRPVPDRVRECVREFERAYGISSTVRVSGHGPTPGSEGIEVVVRTVREGLTNVAKHANGSRVAVTLQRGALCWSVTVEDDGHGDPIFVRHRVGVPAGLSYGLTSLADQAARAAGEFTVGRSLRLGGLRVTTTVPTGRASA